MKNFHYFDVLEQAFEMLDDHTALERGGFECALGQKKSEIRLSDTRHLVTKRDTYGWDVDVHEAKVVGRWHANGNGLSYYPDEEALPSVVVRTAKKVVAQMLAFQKNTASRNAPSGLSLTRSRETAELFTEFASRKTRSAW